MKDKMKSILIALMSERSLRIAQLAALCWIAIELREISNQVYSGPGMYDAHTDAMEHIARSIDALRSTLALK